MFQINLLKLDPNWGITDDIFQIRQDLQRFIQYITTQLSGPLNPVISTCKVQFHFETKFSELEDSPIIRKNELRSKLHRLKMLVLERDDDNPHVITHLVYYITLISGLGNPKDPKVY